jgi:hypothetical protein
LPVTAITSSREKGSSRFSIQLQGASASSSVTATIRDVLAVKPLLRA